MQINLFSAAVFALLFPALRTPQENVFLPSGPEKNRIETTAIDASKSEDPSAKKTLIVEIVSKSGQEVAFSAFIRHGQDNYFVENETTPYRLELEDGEFSGVFHKLTKSADWEIKAEKYLGEQRLTDIKAAHEVTVVESSGSTISSWRM